MLDHLVVFGVALATVLVATPLVRWMAVRLGAVAVPGERHIHTTPTPSLGGIAIFLGVLASIGVGSQLGTFSDVFRATNEPEAIVFASLLVVVLGVVDDTRGISAPAKLAGQILAAGTLVLFGLLMRYVYIPGNPGVVVSLASDFGAIVTILAIVAMINAVNLVDGLDGLAAGIVLIAAAGLFAYVRYGDPAVWAGTSSAPLVLAAVAGACLGFLVHNFHPASIFMGDTGAMLLGLLLAAAGVSAIGNTVSPTRGDFAAVSIPVLVPALVLAVPFADTIWTILRRLRGGRAVFSPDKKHLHHRLLEIGHSHRRAVLIMYYWSALLAFAAVGGNFLTWDVVLAVLSAGVVLAVVFAAGGRIARRVSSVRSVRAARDEDGDEEGAGAGAQGGEGGAGFVYLFTKSGHARTKRASDQRKRRQKAL